MLSLHREEEREKGNLEVGGKGLELGELP